jgi:hypothetical protein
MASNDYSYIGGMGFNGQFARQQSRAAHVRFTPKADIRRCKRHFRFVPKADIGSSFDRPL